MIFRCENCNHRMSDRDILQVSVPHPKRPEERVPLSQCPECGECERFTNMCDEPDCTRVAGCGWPSPEGYRNTCFPHWRRS